jgi:hypothetical protein
MGNSKSQILQRTNNMQTRLEAAQKVHFLRLAQKTFLEWHSKAVEALQSPSFYVPAYSGYPQMHISERTGMPWFNTTPYSAIDKAPKKYSSLFPHGGGLLTSLLTTTSKVVTEEESETFNKLITWVSKNKELMSYYEPPSDDLTALYIIKSDLGSSIAYAIESCLLKEGIKAAKSEDFVRYFRPYAQAILQKKTHFSFIVPILGIRFPIEHFRINETTFLMKMSPTLQKSRSQIRDYTGNTDDGTVHLATHALVSRRWQIPNDKVVFTRFMLQHPIEAAVSTIEAFFCALRIVNPIPTGFAQILYYLDRAVMHRFADLTPLHGSVIKRYPSGLSSLRYSSSSAPEFTRRELGDLKSLFEKMSSIKHNSLQLALRRLNNCFVRDDDDDALLDSTIGLEVLLGDKGVDAISYKMRMRAAALSKVSGGRFTAGDMRKKVKIVYDARSKLVHGQTSANTAKIIRLATPLSKETIMAREVLRSLARTLIENPQYLNVKKLDDELMLGI